VAWFLWPKGIQSHLKGIDDYLAECGPAEVLSLIAKAKVVTNRKKRAALAAKQSEASSQDWRGGLLTTANGEPKILLANAITALRHAPEWTGVLAYDEFDLSVVMQRPAELAQDTVILDEPLPSAEDLARIVNAQFEAAGAREPDEKTPNRAVDAVCGLAFSGPHYRSVPSWTAVYPNSVVTTTLRYFLPVLQLPN
jgi:hypothetical protein